MNLSKTLVALSSSRSSRRTVIAFPPAGAGATYYTSVLTGRRELPRFIGVQYPGRQARLLDEVVVDRAQLVSEAIGAVRERARAGMCEQITLLGHSLGAQVAFEVALELQNDPMIRVTDVVLSARDCPGWDGESDAPDAEFATDAELLAWLHRIGGVPDIILGHPELSAMVARALRADLLASECPAVEGTLDVPLVLLCGLEDPITSMTRMRGWAERTSCGTQTLELPGGHDAVRSAAAHWIPQVWEGMTVA